jgi:predicted metal-dependent hydrolase
MPPRSTDCPLLVFARAYAAAMSKRERISDFVRSFDQTASPDIPTLDYYGVFFQLWNRQRYYEAHDVLEQLWLAEKDAELARFYQALIQAAGAFVHLQKNFEHPSHAKHGRRLRPAARLFALALRNLEYLPNEFRALNLERFRQTLARYRDELSESHFERNPWSPQSAPQLSLSARK